MLLSNVFSLLLKCDLERLRSIASYSTKLIKVMYLKKKMKFSLQIFNELSMQYYKKNHWKIFRYHLGINKFRMLDPFSSLSLIKSLDINRYSWSQPLSLKEARVKNRKPLTYWIKTSWNCPTLNTSLPVTGQHSVNRQIAASYFNYSSWLKWSAS